MEEKRGKRDIKGILDSQGYSKMYKRLLISLVILTIVLIIFLGYYFFFNEKQCSDATCFKNAFAKCGKFSFVKEDSQALWSYKILGSSGGSRCNVEIILIRLKEGTVENQVLEGKDMECSVLPENSASPEGDLSKCTGLLKEEMQDIIIQRMHNYLLKNCGEIKEEFKV
jgi:hypothetical protein